MKNRQAGQIYPSTAARPFRLLIVMVLLIFSGCLGGSPGPIPTAMEPAEIDTSRGPVQAACKGQEPLTVETKDGAFTISPVATYTLPGVVVGRKSYTEGWESAVSPLDLAIAWGKAAEADSAEYLRFSQGNRWYFFRLKEGAPLPASYVTAHSSNNHTIPATNNIRRAMMTIREKDRVLLEGFLVNLKGTYRDRPVFWNTSLSRSDSGNGACELFYVSKIRIGERVYE